MKVVSTAAELRPFHGGVFVPTMGALHAGHGALIRHAAAEAAADRRPVVVSIFVNPTQFNDPADLARYPRTLDADLLLCESAGATVVFAPTLQVVYPPGETIPTPALPAVATQPGLEDAHRPGHFGGVCQVVARLFSLVHPACAVFGEKDWQQLRVITAMTDEMRLGIRILPSPTVREADGLAMSSRNRFLSPEQRARAVSISRALCEACAETTISGAEARLHRTVSEAGLDVEYAAVRDAQTLLRAGPTHATTAFRCLIAARLGAIRLIDNAAWTSGVDL